MNLLEICDRLFQYMCRFNRSARKGAVKDLSSVRADLKALIADLRAKANTTPGMPGQFEKIEPVLFFFCDFTIKSSNLPNVNEYRELAFDIHELAGDEKFFDLLDLTLDDRSETASERLLIFYTCMGLGFTGMYTTQPEYLRKKMMECAGRLRNYISLDQQSRICPASYENVNTSNFIEPPSSSLVGVMILLVGMTIVLIGAYIYAYQSSAQGLLDTLKNVIQHSSIADSGK